jgi:hypothetical protein
MDVAGSSPLPQSQTELPCNLGPCKAILAAKFSMATSRIFLCVIRDSARVILLTYPCSVVRWSHSKTYAVPSRHAITADEQRRQMWHSTAQQPLPIWPWEAVRQHAPPKALSLLAFQKENPTGYDSLPSGAIHSCRCRSVYSPMRACRNKRRFDRSQVGKHICSGSNLARSRLSSSSRLVRRDSPRDGTPSTLLPGRRSGLS